MLKFRGKFLVRPEVPGSGPEVPGVAGSFGGRGKKSRGQGDFGVNFLFSPEFPGQGRKFRGTEVPGEAGCSGGRGISSGTNPKFQI